MLRRNRIDPAARAAVLAVAAGRIAVGCGAILATGPALRALGFPAERAEVRALARLTGGRDVALGMLTLAVRNDPKGLRAAAIAAVAVDAGDALTLGLATADPATRAAGARGLASGGAAALVGAWACRRLGPAG